MKTTLLFLSFLLFTFSPILTLVLAQDPDLVLDISGNQLQTGTGYYILPVFRGRGGGLTLASTRNTTCPLDVVQAQSEVESGLPAIFTAFNDDNVVRVSADHNIRFSARTICGQSTVWTLATRDEDGETVVSTGGVAGNPGRETLSNWFRIDKDGEDFKIVFCPGVCDICRPRCGEIGIVEENGRWRLAIYNESQLPLKVMFRKA